MYRLVYLCVVVLYYVTKYVMKKIGIFYGSSTDTTQAIAQTIANTLDVDSAHVHNVADATAEDALAYDVILLGSSTWGYGDLQDDMEMFLPKLAALDLAGKQVGLFGCGDSDSYADTFCDAIGEMHDQLAGSGCTFIGAVPAEGYNYDATRAEEDGQLMGLLIDEMNEDNLTGERLSRWIEAIKAEL